MPELHCMVRPLSTLTSDQLRALGSRVALWRQTEAALGRMHRIEPTALSDLAAGELPQPFVMLIAQQRGAKLSDVRRAFADQPNPSMINARLILVTIRGEDFELATAFDTLVAAIPPNSAKVIRRGG